MLASRAAEDQTAATERTGPPHIREIRQARPVATPPTPIRIHAPIPRDLAHRREVAGGDGHGQIHVASSFGWVTGAGVVMGSPCSRLERPRTKRPRPNGPARHASGKSDKLARWPPDRPVSESSRPCRAN